LGRAARPYSLSASLVDSGNGGRARPQLLGGNGVHELGEGEAEMSAMRYKVNPRDVPTEYAARRLGLGLADFEARLPDLIARGFPAADVTTGFFDLKAIEAWMDRRSGLAGMSVPMAKTDRGELRDRIARMNEGANTA
jgi:hypothetical protein